MKKELLKQNKEDAIFIFSKVHENGGDFWATKENGIAKGSPFSTRDAALILHELGYKKKDPIMKHISETIFNTWQNDGRFRIAPIGAIYPCHTIGSARILCYLGHLKDKRNKLSGT